MLSEAGIFPSPLLVLLSEERGIVVFHGKYFANYAGLMRHCALMLLHPQRVHETKLRVVIRRLSVTNFGKPPMMVLFKFHMSLTICCSSFKTKLNVAASYHNAEHAVVFRGSTVPQTVSEESGQPVPYKYGDGFYYPRAAGGRAEPPPRLCDGSKERQRQPGADDALPLCVPGKPGRHSELQLDGVGVPSFWKTLACCCEAL
ncbi:hypothetical protein MG293_014669 [Ovis ammon polii]|uniref:Uncharacterized protein n=1 Tax=Ovis ammon polii TaxID=230172 RepID=A0AAD4TVU6_OVIAM|nr:hypothetical protein MG293_014669 [Ovis ammon polii]